MIKRTFDITARIEQGQIPFCFQVVQNDKDVYVLHIRITDGGQEINYGEISDATITFALANGSVVQSAPERLSVSSAGITYQMGTSEIACPGKVLASIQLIGSGGERLTTARFQFEVVADLITPGAVQSESRFPILQQLVADVEQLKQDIVDLQIPDGSIMDVKLSDATGQIKQRFATHMADNAAHGVNTKVSKSGDTMSGSLGVPFISFLNSTSSGANLAEIQHASVRRWLFLIEFNANLNLWDYDANGGSARATIIIDKETGQLYNLGNKVWHAGIAGPFYKGAGNPEGVVTAPVGAIYQRTDGGASTTLYVKESGSGNTGWRAV